MFFVVDSLMIVIWTVCQMFAVNLFTAGFLGSSLDHLHYFLMSGFCSVLSDVVDWEDFWQMWTPVLSFVMKLGQFSVCCMHGVPFCPDWGLFVISRRNYLNHLHTELSAVYDVFPSTESSASMTSAILTTSRQKFWNDDFKPPVECRYLRCVIKLVSLGFCITSVTDRSLLCLLLMLCSLDDVDIINIYSTRTLVQMTPAAVARWQQWYVFRLWGKML